MKDHRAYWDMLEEEYCDCLTGLALKLREMEDTQALIAESERMELDAAQAERAYALFMQKWQAQEKGRRRAARKAQIRRYEPKIAEIAACILLVVCIAAPLAVANIESVRASVVRFLTQINDEYAEIGIVEEGATIEVPDGWNGGYYLSYIPEGYQVEQVLLRGVGVLYLNEASKALTFHEGDEHLTINIDSEDKVVTYESVNGETALVLEDEVGTSIVWSKGKDYFILQLDEPKEEALKVARGVCMIEAQ